jgi:hypothetical protein
MMEQDTLGNAGPASVSQLAGAEVEVRGSETSVGSLGEPWDGGDHLNC